MASESVTRAIRPGARSDVDIRADAPPLLWEWLGRVPYREGLALQEQRVAERRAGAVADCLLLLEHPHVITLGSSARPEHVRIDDAERRLLGIELYETGRGGDVTYHGPGQLVGYPILALEPARRDLHAYVRDIEEAIIRCLAEYDVEAARVPGRTGVWVGASKIAAIGVRVSSGWITSHGFALNINTDLSFFDAIVPCGIVDASVTSLESCTRRAFMIQDVAERIAHQLSSVFERRLIHSAAKTSRKT
ncbi:MAG: lipoyl(octanoyl) transferase LipB [Gemmatimonadetes bacterium]|nr:lipoyl(octanoyl) transferase LipB [Gemmatimonadota bacterium]